MLLKSAVNSCSSPVCLRADGRGERNVNYKIQCTRKVTFNGLRRKIQWPFPCDFRVESSGLEHSLVQSGQAGSI